MGVWYATREDVAQAVDFASTGRNDRAIDRALEASSREADRITNRHRGGFWPEVRTRRFDWPSPAQGTPWRLWVEEPELVALTSVSSGGAALDVADVKLYPDGGPPFDRLELDRSTSAEFGRGSTPQNDVEVLGVWGYRVDTAPAGTLAAAVVSASATTVDVADGSIGVGSLLTVGAERLIVTGRSNLDTTQTVGGAGLTASSASVALTVQDGSKFTADEELVVDAERLLVTDVAGNVVTVKRAAGGTVLAAHTVGAAIYARRRLTVTRGALGTTAGTHLIGAAVVRAVWPGVLARYVVGAAAAGLVAEGAALARQAGSGDRAQDATGVGVDALAEGLVRALGRDRVRHGAV